MNVSINEGNITGKKMERKFVKLAVNASTIRTRCYHVISHTLDTPIDGLLGSTTLSTLCRNSNSRKSLVEAIREEFDIDIPYNTAKTWSSIDSVVATVGSCISTQHFYTPDTIANTSIRYTIAETSSALTIAQMVNKMIDDGWLPLGGINVTVAGNNGNGNKLYTQSMTKSG